MAESEPGELNIASYSADPNAALLSNFAHTPFAIEIGGVRMQCASVEGLWQGLKWPPGDGMRESIFALSGVAAKLAGAAAPPSGWLLVGRRRIKPGSRAHHMIAEMAMRAKLQQNLEVRQALVATDGHRLTHHLVDELGEPVPDSKTLPAAVFVGIWTRLREEIVSASARPTGRG